MTAPTSHVDLVPTLLGAAGVDVAAVAASAPADEARAVYVLTRDNMLEGGTGASGLARRLKQTVNPPAPLRIRVPAHVGSNFEGMVVRVDEAGGRGHLWKLVRTFDDPGTWTEPGLRHLAANGFGGEAYRSEPLDDQWELYDLTDDPTEAVNRWTDPDLHELRRASADAAETSTGFVGAGAEQPVAVRIAQAPDGGARRVACCRCGLRSTPVSVTHTAGRRPASSRCASF